MKSSTTRPLAYVAMSGGVDSSVAAMLMIRDGYNVVGVFMRPWQPEGFACLWQRDRADALAVASRLDIPLETWDFSHEYARRVSRPMVTSYRRGLTPNPDVECNRHIKFGSFYREAMRRGASVVATGHYARTGIRGGTPALLTAVDDTKDQTYFLWGIDRRCIPNIRFPLGSLRKTEVRALARRAGLPTADKKDSQGVCFIGPLDVKSFLTSAIKPRRGGILHVDGRKLGYHDGAAYYTIGQRHGLDIRDGGGPYFVVTKDATSNTVTVGPERALYTVTGRVTGLTWLGQPPARGRRLGAKIRYRAATVPVEVKGSLLTFKRPVRAIAPGQSVVFYAGTQVLGGGILR